MSSLSTNPRQRRCKFSGCRDYFIPKRKGLKLEECCGPGCELSFAEECANKAFKAETTRMRKAFNEKDIKWQHAQCKVVFNKMRRLEELKWFADRGLEPTCISCGKPIGNDVWCCGHFKTVGASGGLRYSRINTYLQHNKRCNMDLSGDIYGTKTTHGYLKGLANRFGNDEALAIIDYCETETGIVKWVWQDMKAMRQEWSIKIRELEKELKIV